MRELKFRVWHPDDYRIYYFSNFAEIVDWQHGDDYRIENQESCMVNYMQYTGLKDKNGIEIYEGDIVRKFSNINKFTDSFAENIEPSFTTTSIVRDEGAFKVTYNGKPDSVLNHNSMSMVKHMEVIGNIYENKDLIEVE